MSDPRLNLCDWRPDDEARGLRRKMTVWVPLNLALAAWYFGWLFQPGRVGNPVLFGLLVAAEMLNLLQALGFWWTAFHARPRPRPSGQVQASFAESVTVDVLIPVYDEPIDIVEPTVAAAAALRGVKTFVYLLDDKGRDELAQLADRHGVDYIRRGDNVGAKAGNLNYALARTTSPFIAVFDCDHVPHPDFLLETAACLREPDVALVQTPQYYANNEGNPVAAAAWSQQSLFFGVIAQGKSDLGAMFCCGTNVLLRRSALDDVGGFPEGSLTEDFLLSVNLHKQGWQTSYLPKVLAQGLGPEDAASYVSQQRRWSKGCVAAIPALLRGRLPWRQRLQYLLSSSFFLSGWAVLIYMSLPVIRITTGEQPLARATADQFLVHFIPYYILSLAIVAMAGAGRYSFAAFCLFVSNYWIHVEATLSTLLRSKAAFTVTSKRGATARQPRAVAPALITVAVLASVATVGAIISPDPGTLNNVAFAGFHVSLLLGGAWPALVGRRQGVATALEAEDTSPAIPGPRGDRLGSVDAMAD